MAADQLNMITVDQSTAITFGNQFLDHYAPTLINDPEVAS